MTISYIRSRKWSVRFNPIVECGRKVLVKYFYDNAKDGGKWDIKIKPE